VVPLTVGGGSDEPSEQKGVYLVGVLTSKTAAVKLRGSLDFRCLGDLGLPRRTFRRGGHRVRPPAVWEVDLVFLARVPHSSRWDGLSAHGLDS
jgi:hypothetical protein